MKSGASEAGDDAPLKSIDWGPDPEPVYSMQSSTIMDRESKSFHRVAEKEKSIHNVSTPQQDGSKKQERDDFDRSIKMRESGINSPKPEVTEKGNGSEAALEDPYK